MDLSTIRVDQGFDIFQFFFRRVGPSVGAITSPAAIVIDDGEFLGELFHVIQNGHEISMADGA